MLPVQGHGEEIPARRGKADLTGEFRKVGRVSEGGASVLASQTRIYFSRKEPRRRKE
jgi:hypothetical protein